MTLPTWREVRRRLQELAVEAGQWAGYPVPVAGVPLRVAPRHEMFERWDGGILPSDDATPSWRTHVCSTDDVSVRERSSWWSRRLGARVFVYESEEDGRIGYAIERKGGHAWLSAHLRWARTIETMHVGSEVWDIEAEAMAFAKLIGMLTDAQVRTYIALGAFVEASRRSQARYVFRRGLPTVVLLPNVTGNFSPSVTLCLHPLAYYDGTFAGGMVPSDDVIAHLLLMRADEPRYWRQANQHPIDRPESGI